MPRKPIIIIFNTNQWRGVSLGHLGLPAAITANLDKIITEDVVFFSNVFCRD
tara:strand:+ start:176 stop:331 length:156 start_codon:yes stop_codon:yes gene_type:complete